MVKSDPKLLLQKVLASPLGTLTVQGTVYPKLQGGRNKWMVDAVCATCKIRHSLHVDNVLSGKTTNCRCQRALTNGSRTGSTAAKRLGERYDAIHQRCSNPTNEHYHNYGGRGIKNLFTRDQFIRYCLQHFPHTDYKNLEIDRIKNNGHYEPGNIRFVSCGVNIRNRRNTKTIQYSGLTVVASDLWHLLKTDYPEFHLSQDRTARLASRGVPVDEILLIKPRVKRTSTTLSTPDPSIVLLYRES